jgi:hypothetical protein
MISIDRTKARLRPCDLQSARGLIDCRRINSDIISPALLKPYDSIVQRICPKAVNYSRKDGDCRSPIVNPPTLV